MPFGMAIFFLDAIYAIKFHFIPNFGLFLFGHNEREPFLSEVNIVHRNPIRPTISGARSRIIFLR